MSNRTFRVNRAAVITTMAALVVGVTIGMAIQFRIDHPPIPPCTDYIADNGGICQGPLID